jgi:hypothetical protein
MLIEFQGYSADCLIAGRLKLTAPRLTDQLNATGLLELTDVLLEGLADGYRVTVPTYTIPRDELCAVRVTGPRGSRSLRVTTVPHRLQVQIGPFNILGRLNAAPGADVFSNLVGGHVMLPLTDATIAYVVGGVLEVRDVSSVIVNRELASWVRTAQAVNADRELLPDLADAAG